MRHGENMVDCLGAEVDRIEKNLKQKHPEVQINSMNLKVDIPNYLSSLIVPCTTQVRHVDLEVL